MGIIITIVGIAFLIDGLLGLPTPSAFMALGLAAACLLY